MRGEGDGQLLRNVSLRGAWVDLPKCHEGRRGKHKKHKRVRVFGRRRPLSAGDAFTSKTENTDFFVLMCLPQRRS